jgi:diguanylate cyclase (GGDEF)-like protein
VADRVVLLVVPAVSAGAALRDRLAFLGFRCEVVEASGPPRGWLDADPAVIVVVDPGGYSGTTAQVLARRAGTSLEEVPLVVVGSPPGAPDPESTGVDEVLAADVDDALLGRRLRAWCRWGALGGRLRELRSRLAELQDQDPLSGLPGHRGLHEKLESEVKRSERYGSPLGLLIGDIEGMREINEKYGYRTGDRILREVGQTLRRALRQADFVARYEGDAFALVLPESGPEATRMVLGRLRSLVGNLIFRGESPQGAPAPLLKVSILFGHACFPGDAAGGRTALLAAAESDLARLRASRAGPAVPA